VENTYLVGTRLGNETKIGNIDGLLQGSLVGCIKDCIERDVLQNFVDSEFMRVENHIDDVKLDAAVRRIVFGVGSCFKTGAVNRSQWRVREQ
jgi:hypothetical protein